MTLVDRGDVCAGCSYGNSGLLVPSHSVPLAAPGVIWRALRWMTKPDSPFYIRPRPSPSLISWLWRFRAACSEENVERAMPALRDLTMTGVELFRELADACESDFGLGTAGVSYVYRTEEGLENGRSEAAHIAKVGLQAEELDRDGVREFAGLETTAIGGMLHPYDGHVTPGRYVQAVAEAFERGGGTIARHTAVTGFETDGRRVTGVVTDNGVLQADETVLAAGSWSPAIASRLGVRLPIQPAKGYSVRFRRPENAPAAPLILGEARVGMTPMGDTIRLAGTLEMAGMDLSNRPEKARRRPAVGRALLPVARAVEARFRRGVGRPEAADARRRGAAGPLAVLGQPHNRGRPRHDGRLHQPVQRQASRPDHHRRRAPHRPRAAGPNPVRVGPRKKRPLHHRHSRAGGNPGGGVPRYGTGACPQRLSPATR